MSRYALATAILLASCAGVAAAETARGVVYDDQNANRIRDAGEPGIADVGVSNGRDVVLTDADGRYALPVDGDTVIFVIKPRDWMTPLSDEQLPQFYYVHCPARTTQKHFGGVPATGPLPAQIDFPLQRRPEPEQFDVVMFGDTQPRDQKEIDYFAHDIVEELIDFDAAFGVTLGDILFDDLSLFDSHNRTVALIGPPWYNVPGNHDLDFDANGDGSSMETFKRIYGPPYYAFNHGPVHFIVIDDVHYLGGTQAEKGKYHAEIGPRQMQFIKQDLAHVADETLVVLMFHIPLQEIKDRQALFDVLADHPKTLSFAAHHHTHRHVFFDKDDGWRGEYPHHHLVTVTTCGSWWAGMPDEYGIPHTTMRDGGPNGYMIVSFDGDKYKWRYKAARRPASFQMHIHAPEVVAVGQTNAADVLINVFDGSQRSKVRLRVRGHGDWQSAEQVAREDPYYRALRARWAADPNLPGRRPPSYVHESTHLWLGRLPADLPAGTHLIEVETTDMFGQTYAANRVIRVEAQTDNDAQAAGSGQD